MSQKTEEGGRWGRTPYRPDDLREQYGTVESGRLDVTCPGCGEDFYPVASCCVKRGSRTADPFCPTCGVDFRASEEDVDRRTRFTVEARTDEAAERLRRFVEDELQLEQCKEWDRWTEIEQTETEQE